MDCLLINENSSVFLRNQRLTQNSSFAGSQTLLASENEFSSTGNFISTETVGGARRPSLGRCTGLIERKDAKQKGGDCHMRRRTRKCDL